ncbi:MAG TPA: NAD(P)-binding protein [Candidatus Lustribacter sp.]|nr:NAD(P)-binding protein [Candidatus Lustribacter sp.]
MSTLLPGHVGTLIVGAGFAGIAMAIRLRAAGDEDWVIIERGPALGGTWRDNDYPGAACDVQSVLYSYSFAPWPSWTRSYSPRQEIQDYLVHVATERGVGDRVVCDTDLLEARWDDDHGVWRVRTSRGELTAAVLVPPRARWPTRSCPISTGSPTSRGASSTLHAGRPTSRCRALGWP